MNKRAMMVVALALSLVGPASALAAPGWDGGWGIRADGNGSDYPQVIQSVEQMPWNGELVAAAQARNLTVVNLMWEDTGRAAGSALGPNISDLTLQVREHVAGGIQTHLLPVIRNPNFADQTADLAADKLWVRVGNERRGGKPHAVPLTEVLRNLREYLSDASSLRGSDNFLAPRDTHFLVSAQHVFLPIPKSGKAEFNPVLFNYQSAPGSPAVLTLLVTREGTSARVIENRPGDQSLQGWGQQLFFNHAGQRSVFTAERKSDVKARIERGEARPSDDGALEEGADMMMIVQVPLVHQDRGVLPGLEQQTFDKAMPAPPATGGAPMQPSSVARRGAVSDVEHAVLGHGEDMGRFEEMGGLRVVRDTRFPIRVTVQFYKATSNGVVSPADLAEVASTIQKVYASGDYVGSLVVPAGERTRPTDWIKDQTRNPTPKPSWWSGIF
jgi:hypothetical protein